MERRDLALRQRRKTATLFKASPGNTRRNTAATAPGRCRRATRRRAIPNHWKIVDGKLYLNYDAKVQRNWEQDVPGHIASANKNWPKVLEK